jgi:hypothetical protein
MKQNYLMLDYLKVLKSKNIKDLESFLDKNPSFINSQSQSYHTTLIAAIDDNFSEVEKLLITMLQGKAAQKADREALTKKEKIRDAKMLTNENSCINMHGIPSTLSAQQTPSKVSNHGHIPISIINIFVNRVVRRSYPRQQSPRKRSNRNNHLFPLFLLSSLISALKFSMH